MIWAIYFLAAFGLSFIIGGAKISYSLRALLGGSVARPAFQHPVTKEQIPAQEEVKPLIPIVGPWLCDLMECFACTGTWIGFAASFWLPQPHLTPALSPPAWCLALGCATCASSYLLGSFAYKGTHAY